MAAAVLHGNLTRTIPSLLLTVGAHPLMIRGANHYIVYIGISGWLWDFTITICRSLHEIFSLILIGIGDAFS